MIGEGLWKAWKELIEKKIGHWQAGFLVTTS